jgi:hypothetical protein
LFRYLEEIRGDVRFVFGFTGDYVKPSFERLNDVSVFQVIDSPPESPFFQFWFEVTVELKEFFA